MGPPNINISSNDPINPQVAVTVELDVLTGIEDSEQLPTTFEVS